MGKRRNLEGTKFLQYFGPLLDALRKLGGSGTPDEAAEQVATDLTMSDELQNELLPSGGLRYRTNIAWARFYLVKEGLLDSSKRGVWRLTERGRNTHLTLTQSGEIFSRWVKIFDQQRRIKSAGSEPLAEQVAEAGGHRSLVRGARLETTRLPARGRDRDGGGREWSAACHHRFRQDVRGVVRRLACGVGEAAAEIDSSGTTLLFTNTRAQAE